MPKKSTIIIFDFDGTLVSTKSVVISELNSYCKEHGLKRVNSISDMRNNIGVAHLISQFTSISSLRQTIKQRTLDAIEKFITECDAPEGIIEVLINLAEQHTLGIVTTNRISTVNAFLDEHNIKELFKFVCSTDNKTDCLGEISNQSNRLFYIGDQVSDIEQASTHAYTVAVCWGYDDRSDLVDSNPDLIIDRPQDLLTIKFDELEMPIRQARSCCIMM